MLTRQRITVELCKQLQEMAGCSMADAKSALLRYDGDLDKAATFLNGRWRGETGPQSALLQDLIALHWQIITESESSDPEALRKLLGRTVNFMVEMAQKMKL